VNAPEAFWRTVTPQLWPLPPDRFSHSSLAEVEECPRRWALRRGEYAGLWSGQGYPRRPAVGALSGQVAHLAIERVTNAVNDARDPTFEGVVAQLRRLGGISQVISQCVSDEILRLADNPRAAALGPSLHAELTGRIPDLRFLVQSALNRLVTAMEGETTRATAGHRGVSPRTALSYGYHPEVELAPPGLGWIGHADAIRLTETECEIVDYKTGTPSSSHEEQLRLYALLWQRDSVINPAGRSVTRLVLVYPGSTRDVAPPVGGEVESLEAEMVIRVAEASLLLRESPPPARVHPDTCRFCDLKHLCVDYWTTGSQARLAVTPEPNVRSLQGVVVEHRGSSVTIVRTELDPYLPSGTDLVVTGLDAGARTLGQRLRLIDVRVTHEPDTMMAVVTLGAHSEVFIAPS
jgi:hypothetical protein